MAQTRFAIAAPLFLALAFLGHMSNVLILEPGIGFRAPADFYDAGKLLQVVDHPVWLLGALYHAVAATAMMILAQAQLSAGSAGIKPYSTVFGSAAAVTFFIVCLTNIVGLRQLAMAAELDAGDISSINSGFLIFRTVLLNAAVLFTGAFLLLGSIGRLLIASDRTLIRYIGLAAGLIAIAAVLLPMVTPAFIFLVVIWGVLAGISGLTRQQSED